jgi:hypothetical protein
MKRQQRHKKEGIQHTKAKLGEYLKKKRERKVMHGQYIRSADSETIGEENTMLWLVRGDLGATLTVQQQQHVRHCKPNVTQQSYDRQQQTASASSAHNFMRQRNTSHQHSQYCQNNNT